jgi:spore germination cell wall hydrolase CwlJ-like protein
MRSRRSMSGNEVLSTALVVQAGPNSVVVRNSDLAVIPPRPIPLTLKARRSLGKLVGYGALAAIFAFAGYGLGNSDIRRTIDYRLTLLISSGVSSFAPTDRMTVAQPLPDRVMHLFAQSLKGPRADRFAHALMLGGSDGAARETSGAPLNVSAMAEQPGSHIASLAGAALFLTAFNRQDETPPPAEFDAPPSTKPGGQWAGLMKNATLSPEEPKALFGGLTEDEFRARELRCMATAIYFEARAEPVQGQIAVAQVVMNRIRSPFYPKTICGVVYQGERNRHGCQFSFTCTGKRNVVNEPEQWTIAVKLAKQVIAGEVWINEVGYATHYHANYVHPGWRELDKVAQIGRHIFYKMKPGTIQVALVSEGL